MRPFAIFPLALVVVGALPAAVIFGAIACQTAKPPGSSPADGA